MIKINEIMFYGRYYDNEERPYSNIWWYSKTDERIFSIDEIIQLFNYRTEDEIIECNIFIPLFKVNIFNLEKAFISDLNNKEITKLFKNIDGKLFDIKFLEYIDRDSFVKRLWFEYEEKNLYTEAVKWCRDNHIPYNP